MIHEQYTPVAWMGLSLSQYRLFSLFSPQIDNAHPCITSHVSDNKTTVFCTSVPDPTRCKTHCIHNQQVISKTTITKSKFFIFLFPATWSQFIRPSQPLPATIVVTDTHPKPTNIRKT